MQVDLCTNTNSKMCQALVWDGSVLADLTTFFFKGKAAEQLTKTGE